MRDLTHLIERLEAFEDRAGVRLDALYAKLDGNTVWKIDGKDEPGIRINGEIHPREGTSLKQSVTLFAEGYDGLGRLFCTKSSQPFLPQTFFGYETFSLVVGGIPAKDVVKIRLYPKHKIWG
jgi:hypothetical protein